MSTVSDTLTVVVVGKRPSSPAAELFADVASGDQAILLSLGLRPTATQQLLAEQALSLAAERRFGLTAETIADVTTLRDRVRDAGTILISATRGERRRWNLEGNAVSRPGAG